MSGDLEAVRNRIDQVDLKILELLRQRYHLVNEVKTIKAETGMDAHQPARFENMLIKLKQEARALGIHENLVQEIWDAIHKDSITQQES